MAQFQLSEKEFVRASLRLASKRLRRTLVFVLVALALLAASQIAAGRSLVAAVVGFAIGAALFTAVIYFMTAWRLKSAFRKQDSFRQAVNVVIDDNQLDYTSPGGNYAVPWSAVRRSRETGEFFLLFENDLFARILPKRALSEDESALIRSKTSSLPTL